jgi:hypothetical protein
MVGRTEGVACKGLVVGAPIWTGRFTDSRRIWLYVHGMSRCKGLQPLPTVLPDRRGHTDGRAAAATFFARSALQMCFCHARQIA